MEPAERAEYIKQKIARLEQQLQPSDANFVLDLIGGLANALDVEAPTEKRIAAFYVPELQRFPPDILDNAARELVRSWRWNYFPKIAHFCSEAEEMLSERRKLLSETREWLRPALTTQKQRSAFTRKLSGPKRISDCLPKSIKVD